MRFLLYNLRYCVGTGAGFHFPFPFRGYLRPARGTLDRMTGFIRSTAPDIAGLVEVDAGSFRTGRVDQAEHLARSLGHYHIHQSKYGTDSLARRLPIVNKQGNAFLVRDRIHNERFHFFESGIKRLVIELELERFVVFLVHLSLKFRHRAYQLTELATLVRAVEKPCLVAGDFNTLWGSRELDLFMQATGLRTANERRLPTYPSWAPRRELDFVLYGPGVRVRELVIPRVTFSDHLPLICDFEPE